MSPLSESWSYMSQMESVGPAGRLVRRYYRCQLQEHREQPQKTNSPSRVLELMVQEAYSQRSNPSLLKRMKNELGAGNNWVSLQKAFGVAAPCIVTVDGKEKIWNQS
ncbi:hypothetical protein LTR96_011863, partial [Exophiala xenobiotica]